MKEADRLRAVHEGLDAFGANASAGEDWLEVTGPSVLRAAHVSSLGDHRLAMTWAVAGLIAEGETIVEDFGAVEVSYPGFAERPRAPRRERSGRVARARMPLLSPLKWETARDHRHRWPGRKRQVDRRQGRCPTSQRPPSRHGRDVPCRDVARARPESPGRGRCGCSTALAEENPVTFDYAEGAQIANSVHIAGRDVTAEVRFPVVDANVSAVSAVPGVRTALVEQQRLLASAGDTVAEGRDIGTVVFPHAEVKIFLTASAEERARRRRIDLANQGHEVDQDEVQARLERRDAYDSSREVSPLEAAVDAELLDTTGLSIEQVVDAIVERVEGRAMKYALLPRFAKATVGRMFRVLFRTRLDGAENIPRTGAILAGNHVSYLDPILLWCASPRPVHFMAKRELWDSRFMAWLLPRFWAFPVNRGEPDRTAITTATELLRAGELVGVFPEGGRAEDGSEALASGPGRRGVHRLACRCADRARGFRGHGQGLAQGCEAAPAGADEHRVGSPIDVGSILPDGGRKERVTAVTAVVMERIASELEMAGKVMA